MPPTTTHRAPSGTCIAPWVLALVVLAGVLWVDVAIKEWAQASLREPVRITSWLYLAIHHNSGLFLGTPPVSAVSIVHWPFVFCALAWLGWRMVRTGSSTVGVGYALVTGGFVGNVFGRANGAVVDYLGFGPVIDDKWAFANFADIAILGGALLLGVVLVRSRIRASRRPSA